CGCFGFPGCLGHFLDGQCGVRCGNDCALMVRDRSTSSPYKAAQKAAYNKSDGNKNSQLDNQQRHMVSSYSKLLKSDEHIRRQFSPPHFATATSDCSASLRPSRSEPPRRGPAK